jgi:uncharacterized membrane protein
MTEPAHNPQNRHPSKASAGGFFLFLGPIVGAILGIIYDQPSLGMVVGFGAGVIIACIVWMLDRRRS